MKKVRSGVLFALIAALCFGTVPAIVKSAYDGNISVLSLLAIRSFLAAVVLVPTALLRDRHKFPAVKLSMKIMSIAGVFLAFEAGLYFYAISLLPTSLATLILFTFPLFVNLYGFFTGRRISLGAGLAMILCMAGLAIMLGTSIDHINPIGILSAFLSAISYAIYLVLIEELISGVSPYHANAMVSVSTAVTMTIAAFATRTFSLSFRGSVWISILLLVLISNILGFQFFFKALKLLGSGRTSVLNMSEPLFTVLIAILFLKESLSAVQMLGAGTLIIGLFLFMYFKERQITKKKGILIGM